MEVTLHEGGKRVEMLKRGKEMEMHDGGEGGECRI